MSEEDPTLIKHDIKPVPDQPTENVDLTRSQLRLQNNLTSSIVNNQSISNQEKPPQQGNKLMQSFYYQQGHNEESSPDSPAPGYLTSFLDCQGVDSQKKYNFKILDQENIIYISGTFYVIFNLYSHQKRVFICKDGGGIGCIAIFPDSKYFAVLEKGKNPNVYIYDYPGLRLYRILRKGTQKSFSSGCFSKDGELLATVGSSPDYLMCIWDWRQQNILLKAKAFSQQVYRVTFSQYNNKMLTTSGMGHIKMWKIAQTFTGLKLQGQIAKFGQFQLSDVASYYQFQDGKVISSSQYGNLLLWEGNLIKCVIFKEEGVPCHVGPIEVVMKFEGTKQDRPEIVSAGKDGYIRFWDMNTIQKSQSDQKFNFYLQPLRQIYMEYEAGIPAHILSLDFNGKYWVIQDQQGKVFKSIGRDVDKYQLVLQTNSGRISDLSISPINNSYCTVGKDGVVRLWDIGIGRQYYKRNFAGSSEGTCLEWAPYNKRNAGRVVVVGFSDGIVRFLLLNSQNFVLLKSLKVHKSAIHKIRYSPDGSKIAVASQSGDIFFLSLESDLQDIKPYSLHQTKMRFTDMVWNKTSTCLLVGTTAGTIHEINVPLPEQCDSSQTYLKQINMKTFQIKMMQSQKPKKQQLQLQMILKKTKRGSSNQQQKKQDEEWQPAEILNLAYYDNDCSKVICAVDGKFLGFLYIVQFGKPRPINSISITKAPTSFLSLVDNKDLIIIGFKTGFWQLRHRINTNKYLQRQSHDQDYGKLNSIVINMDKNVIVTGSEDGTMLMYKIDYTNFVKTARTDIQPQPNQVFFPSILQSLSQVNFMDSVEVKEGQKDILNSAIYSIQQEKLKAQEDHKRSLANKTKEMRLIEVSKIQKEFLNIKIINQSIDSSIRFTPQELIVDPEYVGILQQRVQMDLEQVRKQLKWDTQFYNLTYQKIKKYMIEDLQCHRFGVCGLTQPGLQVISFKVKKTSEFMKAMIQREKLQIQSEALQRAKQAQSRRIQATIDTQDRFQLQIRLAQQNKGDYKLKSDSNYVVPQNQLMNVRKKQRHLFMLYEYMFNVKMKFNNSLKKLLKQKKDIIKKVHLYNQRIAQINQRMNLPSDSWNIYTNPQIQIESVDQQLSLNDKDVQQAFKNKYKKPLQQEKKKEQKKQKVKESQAVKVRKAIKIQKSQLEQESKKIEELILLSSKKRMQNQVANQLRVFDQELLALRSQKIRIQSDIVMAQMKMVTYNQEYVIFADMQSQDMKLIKQLQTYKEQKSKLQANLKNIQSTLQELQKNYNDLQKKKNQEMKLFDQSIYPQDQQKRMDVLRYFEIKEKNKMNSKKNKKVQQEGDQQEQQQEDQEYDDDFGDDGAEKPDLSCVQTGDNKNMDIIKKIIDYNVRIQDNRMNVSAFTKNKKQAFNKIQKLKVQLNKAEHALKQFQKQKLKKVNQLDVTFPLKLSQVQTLKQQNQTTLPKDLKRFILFTKQSLFSLQNRIEDLKSQKDKIGKEKDLIKAQNKKIERQLSKIENQIKELNKSCKEKHMLKFGEVVDLQYIKCLSPSPQVLQLQKRIKKEEKEISKRIEDAHNQVLMSKKRLLQVKKQNTQIINQITQLGTKQMQLNKKLDSTNKALFKSEDEQKKSGLQKQRQNIQQLIKFLQREIEDLKKQIGLFKRKGGHIYTMVTSSNRRNFQ